jgi:hypothetical protein
LVGRPEAKRPIGRMEDKRGAEVAPAVYTRLLPRSTSALKILENSEAYYRGSN